MYKKMSVVFMKMGSTTISAKVYAIVFPCVQTFFTKNEDDMKLECRREMTLLIKTIMDKQEKEKE